jgi:hypothetical protein
MLCLAVDKGGVPVFAASLQATTSELSEQHFFLIKPVHTKPQQQTGNTRR